MKTKDRDDKVKVVVKTDKGNLIRRAIKSTQRVPANAIGLITLDGTIILLQTVGGVN